MSSQSQVDLEKRKVKALKRQVASLSKGLEDARARVLATDEDMDRFRQQQRKTPEGGLRQEVFRLGAAKAEAEMQVTHIASIVLTTKAMPGSSFMRNASGIRSRLQSSDC